ncbi:MAG: hypothetical protein COB38_02360 [Gammaproteobacteria bacterium]|nr:MAG: hypothetical protein COB38_02360 [Gammaproteobacteria bacterium]
MKCSNKQSSVLKHSIIWATLIIALSYLLKDNLTDSSIKNTIFIFMIGAWYMSHSLLSKAHGLKMVSDCETKLFRRFFSNENSKDEK